MEVVGLTISVASLAALFQTTIDCFGYVQSAKEFSIEVQTSFHLLDNAKQQLSSWGAALGLKMPVADINSLETLVPDPDVEKAEELLGHILKLVQDAESVMSKFKMQSSEGSQPVTQETTQASQSLHQRMRNVYRHRQKSTSRLKKAQWAVCEKEHLDALVANIRMLVADLLRLFPATVSAEQSVMKRVAQKPTLPDVNATGTAASHAAGPSQTWNNYDGSKVFNQGGYFAFSGDQNFYL